MVKQPPFLDRLTPETRGIMEERGVQRTWPRRAVIFRMREQCTGMHVVSSGLIKLYRSNTSGREQIVLLEGAGGVLSVTPILDGGEHLASAETLQVSSTLFLEQSDFVQLYHEQQDFREAVVAELARRFRAVVGLVETISLKPVGARVATRLIELASANDALDGTQEFNLLLSQDELAHVLSTTRESVARALSELRSAGVIEQRGSRIRVKDPQLLLEWSQMEGQEGGTPLPLVI